MKKIKRAEHLISKKVGLAINRYGMIGAGDKVLVGVSGGKDSLTLLRILQQRKRWVPIDYKVKAIHVITDYDRQFRPRMKKLEEYFRSVGCDYVFKKIEIAEKNKLSKQDCFWCSWNRRKALFETAAELGFNKIALGHHKDDVAETILMNMIFNGELSGINPVQSLFGGKVAIVRPLVFLEEKEILEYAKDAGLPRIRSYCPRNRDSKRVLVKNMITRLAKGNRDVKNNILKALHRIKTEYIEDITEERISAGKDDD
jgi:tRNA 2-thiocytidine biosynthesis protein TtcA